MDADDAIAVLVERTGDSLLRLAYQLTHDRGTAQDIVQESLLAVLKHRRRAGIRIDNLEGYARRVVVNEFLRRRRLMASSEVVTSHPPDDLSAQSHSHEHDIVERDELWLALATVSTRQRAVLVLRYWNELPDREIAVILGCREATVRSLAARGLTSLRSCDRLVDPSASGQR